MRAILLVDDDDIIRRSVKRILHGVLANTDVEILEATNGEEALALLRNGLTPAVILSDVDMPKMNGLALVKCCKAEFATIPIVLCSGGSYEEAAEKLGVQYHAKGLDSPAMLREKVLALL